MFEDLDVSRNYFEELPPEGWSFEGAPRLDPFDAAFINQALDSTKASDCITVIEQAERQQAFWSSVQARAAARIDSLTGCTPEDHPVDQERGTAHMVAIARRRSQSGSIAYLHCMRNLIPDMPYLFSRFEAGDLSESLVLAIMGPLDDLPSDERRTFDRMYAHAPSLFDSMSTKAARDFAQKYVDTNHSEEQTLRMEKKARDRFVHIRPGKDCMLVNARLPIEVGLALKNDLESKAMAAKSAGDQRTLEQLRADALVGTATGAPLDRPLPVKLHINLVMTDKSLLLGENQLAGITGYGSIPAEYARRLAIAWQAAGPDSPEEVLDLFRRRVEALPMLRRLFLEPNGQDLVAMDSKERLFKGQLRQMILLRDPFCRTPHCNNTPSHVDHVMQHAKGGQTDYSNASGRCPACNLAKETPGWEEEVVSEAPHKIRIRPTSGVEYASTSPTLVGLVRLEQLIGGDGPFIPPVPVKKPPGRRKTASK